MVLSEEQEVVNNGVANEHFVETEETPLPPVNHHIAEKQGITKTNIVYYPMFILKAGATIEKHHYIILKDMLVQEKRDDILQYHLYLQAGTKKVYLGLLNENLIRCVLTSCIFTSYEKSVVLEDGDEIKGDELYALCPIID